jgi:Flp pilus assembly protein TadG
MARLWRDEAGANAVEFAILLPVVLMLLFGIIYGGLLYNEQLALTQAAREGARFAATNDDAPDGTCSQAEMGDATSWCGQVATRIVNSSNGQLGVDDIDEISHDAAELEITVSVSKPGTLDVVFYSWSPTITGQAVARYEGG